MSDDEKPLKSRITKRKGGLQEDERLPKKILKVEIKREVLDTFEPTWKEHELVADHKRIDAKVAKDVIKMLEDGNTIPFIARYRRNVTVGMAPEELREIKEVYEEVCNLKNKITTVAKAVKKQGLLDDKLKKTIVSVKSMEELEHIYAPFKPGTTRSLAGRAKEAGLEAIALNVLENKKFDLSIHVNPKTQLATVGDVEKGVVHIISSIISTDNETLTFLRTLRTLTSFQIETKKSSGKVKKLEKTVDETKFQNYFDFKCATKYLKPHQILAINRGEAQKVITVKITIPETFQQKFNTFCENKWANKGFFHQERHNIMNHVIKDVYTRHIQPLIIREIRSELKHKAEKASMEVFCTNLKHILLAAPVKGQAILAIDPGFSNGCKIAVVSATGEVLGHDIIFPLKGKGQEAAEILKNLLIKTRCSLIALGSGTACRQTEEWLSNLIKSNYFKPMEIKYTIISEDGASIYSCSPEAKKEFPDLDPNIISAVSLARRVQDPLSELVKVEPQHLGVGMYQHDLKKKSLAEALDEVVSECVSFVGVDLNTTSQCLLRHISGLSDKRASAIIAYRSKIGKFTKRKELLKVKGIGEKVFEQCAGFLRVVGTTNKLDCTIIHPESYQLTLNLLKHWKLSVEDIGENNFINSIKRKFQEQGLGDLCRILKCNEATLQLIIEALEKPLNYDLRVENSETLFRKGVVSLEDVQVGSRLTGRVSNVTHFGCFVDLFLGAAGLVHTSKMNRLNLNIGDKVEVEIISLQKDTKRIALKALKKL